MDFDGLGYGIAVCVALINGDNEVVWTKSPMAVRGVEFEGPADASEGACNIANNAHRDINFKFLVGEDEGGAYTVMVDNLYYTLPIEAEPLEHQLLLTNDPDWATIFDTRNKAINMANKLRDDFGVKATIKQRV